MQTQTPVIFLAFANNAAAPLQALKEEEETIYGRLLPGESQHFYKLHKESFATPVSLARHLTEFKGRVVILHYGGHAEGQSLLLAEGEADAGGIAQMLENQQALQLVFLNGCSTQEQVKRLFELGIPIVIATSCPIPDQEARRFSDLFYSALAKNHTIREAYNQAAGVVNSGDRKMKMEISRSFVFTLDEKEEFPWGLYARSEEDLEWKLPDKNTLQQEVKITSAGQGYTFSETPVNHTLIEVLLNALRPYNRDLEYQLSKKEEDEDVDERVFLAEIINSLPAPIGEQVRKLFAIAHDTYDQAKIGIPRIEQLVSAYMSMVDFFTFTLIVNIWDIKSAANIHLPADLLALIRKLLTADSREISDFNYIRLIKDILNWFDDAKRYEQKDAPVFMPELEKAAHTFRQDPQLVKAVELLEQLKRMIAAKSIPAEELESVCVQGEIHLASLIELFSFCARYKMTTIKDISIRKTRKSTRYCHRQLRLYQIMLGYKDTVVEDEKECTVSNSVILLKAPKKFDDYLDLSPFIIDAHALKRMDGSKLFFYHYYDREKNQLHYRGGDQQEETLILTPELLSNDYFMDIREQFDQFSKLFFGQTLKHL